MDKDLLLHIIEGLKGDVSRIETKTDRVGEKVDQLLQFKWQIVGGSVVISILVTVAIQVASAIFK